MSDEKPRPPLFSPSALYKPGPNAHQNPYAPKRESRVLYIEDILSNPAESSITPCTDTLLARVSSDPRFELYILDFLQADGTLARVPKVGLSVHEVTRGKRLKMGSIGQLDRNAEPSRSIYSLHPRIKYQICSLDGKRVFKNISFQYHVVFDSDPTPAQSGL